MNALDLPTDIWIYILGCYLTSEDIVSLLQTCKSMSSLCSGTSVRIRMVKEAIAQDDLFIPIIDLESTPLNVCKRAVLAPARMASAVTKRQAAMDQEGRQIYPVSQRILPFESKDRMLVMLILPGGRYVVVKTPSVVAVIDILSNELPTEKVCQASHDVPLSTSTPNFIAGPSSDGSKIRIVVAENMDQGFTRRAIVILEFDPSQRELRRIAHRAFDQDSAGLNHTLTNQHADTLAGDLFCFFDSVSYEVYVWNFVKGSIVSWRVEPGLCNNSPLRKLVIDPVRKVFIAFADRTILFWDLDDIISIKKSGPINHFPPKWGRPLVVRDFSDPSSQAHELARQLPFLFSLNIWYHSRHLIPGIDLLLWDSILDHTYSYSYEIYYDEAKGHEPTIELTQMHLIPRIQSHEVGIKHNRLCAGQTFLLWENYVDGRLFAIVKPTVVERERDSGTNRRPMKHAYESGTELVYTSGQTTHSKDLLPSTVPGLSTFDPSSGRLCTTSVEGTRIVVTDFLGDFGN